MARRDPSKAPELRRFVLPAVFVGLLFFALISRRPDISGKPVVLSFQGNTMGTQYTVKIVNPTLDEVEHAKVAQEIKDSLELVNASMSTYKEDSELSRFNRHEDQRPFSVSEHSRKVFSEARRISELSRGAFDITVGPLVNAWGFGPNTPATPPSEETLGALKEFVGYKNVEVQGNHLVKKNGQVQCDLSAIAKGYAVDLVAEKLRTLGFQNFMVEVGGEVITGGRRLDGRIWRIGIEKPDDKGRAVHRAVPLDNMAMATSGDYRNYREVDGKRISHLLDPRTVEPIDHPMASVSVIHSSCMTADALATAFTVMGYEDSLAIAKRDELAAIFLVRSDSGTFEEYRSPAADKILELLKTPPEPFGAPQERP